MVRCAGRFYHVNIHVGFGFEPSTAQLLTAPPCVTGTLGILLGGYLVSRYDARAPILVIGSTMIAISYLALYFIYHKWGKFSIDSDDHSDFFL